MGFLDEIKAWTRYRMQIGMGLFHSPDDNEFLVEGAQLFCINGYGVTSLKVPENHGYTGGDQKSANCKDCKAVENIPYFEQCMKNEETHLCEGYMELAEEWENASLSGVSKTVAGERAINLSSVLLCKKGGVIIPVSSGQEYDGKLDWENFTKRYVNAYFWAVGKDMGCQIYGKDPINMDSGNYLYEKQDLKIQGILPLSFCLFYNSLSDKDQGALGEGWNHTYEISLKEIPKKAAIVITMGDGREVSYVRSLEGAYRPASGDAGELIAVENGFSYRDRNGLVCAFDRKGRLVHMSAGAGAGNHFLYDGKGRLLRAENETGWLQYVYNGENRLIHVCDHTGRKVDLKYQYGKLRWYTDAVGVCYEYDYNENGKLNRVCKPEEGVALKNEYDGANRVLRQTMPDGSVAELRYDDKNNRTWLKEENGNLMMFESDERHRNIRTVCEAGEELYAYNDNNQLTLYTDRNGNTTRYCYDDRGNMTKRTDAAGQVFHMTYDGQNHLIRIKYPDGTEEKYIYNQQGNLTGTTDRLGNQTRAEYDDNHKIRRLIQPDNGEIRIDHDERGKITKIVDASGRSCQFSYNELGQTERITDGNGNTTRYRYDQKGRVGEIINPAGNSRIYRYNSCDRPVEIQDFNGNIHKIQYDGCNRCSMYTDPEGNETSYIYDEAGRLLRRILPNGGCYVYTHTRMGDLESVTDPMGAVTRFQYDANGNCIRIVHPDKGETCYTYDCLNRMDSLTEPDGLTTCFVYDQNNRITAINDNYGNEALLVYDAHGNLQKSTDVYGNTASYQYDCMGRMTQKTDSVGRITEYRYGMGILPEKIVCWDGSHETFCYDGNYNVIRTENQDGFAVELLYDCLNRVTEIRDDRGNRKAYTYDSIGHLLAFTDAVGHTTKYAYTPNGNLERMTDPEGNTIRYQYDCMGQLLSCITPGQEGSAVSSYERDLTGRIVAAVNPLGLTEFYTYDPSGNLGSRTDREGNTETYTYTRAGMLESILYADGRQIKLTHDGQRRLIQVEDWLGVTEIEWGIWRHLRSVTDPEGRKITYEFSPAGQPERIICPHGKTIRYEYDDCLRLVGLSDGEYEVKYRYEAGRLREKEMPGGLKTVCSYDRAGQLSELTHYRDERILDRFRYTYDAVGNRTGVNRERTGLGAESGTYRYEYDALRRLTGVLRDGEVLRQYRYDRLGNRICKVEGEREVRYLYNAGNQLIREEGENSVAYSYDKRGNCRDIQVNGVLEKRYEFDSANRLSAVYGREGLLETMRYNGLGHRTGRTVYGDDPGGKAREITYITDITRRAGNLLEKLEDGKCDTCLWDGTIACISEAGRGKLLLTDELGSVIRAFYHTGKENGIYGYDEFGNRTQSRGSSQPFGYTGYLEDSVSGAWHGNAREYMPTTGTFLSEDRIHDIAGLPQTLNHYAYCMGNPVGWVDRNGMFGQNAANAIISSYTSNQYQMGIELWKDDLSQAADSIGKAVNKGLDLAGRGVEYRADQIKNEVDGVVTGVNAFWSNNVFGVNDMLYQSEDKTISLYVHRGGNFVVVDKSKIGKFMGWAVDLSADIPYINFSAGCRITDAHSPITWGIKRYTKAKSPDGRVSVMIGEGVNKEGVFISQTFSFTTDNLPLELFDDIVVEPDATVTLAMSVDTNYLRWRTVFATVGVVVAAYYCPEILPELLPGLLLPGKCPF